MSDLHLFPYEHDGVPLTGEFILPAGAGPHPGVLIVHDALGMGEVVRTRARELAAAGYAAFAADMYGSGRREQNNALHGPLFAALQAAPERLRARVLAGFEALKTLPGVNLGRLAAIGYCFGGQCVLELARSGADAKAVVSFHGLLTSRLPAEIGAVKSRVLVLTGARDPYAPMADVETFQAEMTGAGADWHLTVYGEGLHAFTDPLVTTKTSAPGIRYDPLLDRLSWAQGTAFLEAAIGSQTT